MDIINIKITFEDKSTGTKLTKQVTRSEDTFNKMLNSIGQTVKETKNGISWLWTVVKIEQI